MRPTELHLKITTPVETVTDIHVRKVVAEATNGAFAILPRHIDFVAPLAVGVLVFETVGGEEHFLGLDEGMLVKCGNSVRIATRRAAHAPTLEALRDRVAVEFGVQSERAMAARSALANLEAGLIRRFVEMERQR